VASALEDARRQNQTARDLLAFGRSLAEMATTDGIVERLASTLPSVVDCHVGAVALWNQDAAVLRIHATFGLPPEGESFLGLEVRSDDTPAVKVLVELREPLFIGESTDDPFLRGLMVAAGMSSAAIVPILAHDAVLGVVAVGRADLVFRPGSDVIERLSGMADLSATALMNARFLEAVQTEALHDPLTGLANARLLARSGADALRDDASGECEVALLFLDLDGFKPVNDELGHDAGDGVLRMCADRLSSAVRDGDTVARLGGDEFVVLMPRAGRQGAEATARRLHDLMEAPFSVAGQEVRLSASIGLALSSAGDEFAALLKRADEAMYATKPHRARHGRDHTRA
jgi:diguanylate cyclase (GGDEF)-like protein